jgi:hypothetical protein
VESDVLERILQYSQDQKKILGTQESRDIFNDLQVILSCIRNSDESHYNDIWNPGLEGDIIRVWNLMNMAYGLTVTRDWKGNCLIIFHCIC